MKKKEHLYEEAETYQKIKLGKSPKGERECCGVFHIEMKKVHENTSL